MSSAITQMAMAVIANEQAEKRAKEQAELQAVIARREAEERSVMRQRVALEAERLMAAKEAERLVAEERAARAREAEEVALRAEIERLRNRSETEILRDEVASLRAEMAGMRRQTETLPTKEVVQESIYSHLRADGELDMRFRSSKQELSVVQQEVVELKAVVSSLLKGGFHICSSSDGSALSKVSVHGGGDALGFTGVTNVVNHERENPGLNTGAAQRFVSRQTWFLKVV